MAEGGLKSSVSAEGINKQEKPGKLSSKLLDTFEADRALTRPQSLPVDRFPGSSRLSTLSLTSSSEEVMISQETTKTRKGNVTIKAPGEEQDPEQLSPSSAEEDILSDNEAVEEKGKKKRKSRWKWSPFKKMRKLFSRKKSPTRAKSCEELPVERYKPTNQPANPLPDDPLRNRTVSEPSLLESQSKLLVSAAETKRSNTGDHLVQRTHSDPSRQHGIEKLLGLNKKKKSQEDIGEEPLHFSSDENESRPGSMDWSMRSSDSGTEAAVSFETLPSASSLEGLQAAHDRIKVAPRHRRPPTRAHPKSLSMNVKTNPVRPHRRSKTDPQDLEAKRNSQIAGSNRNSDIVSTTIYETTELGEQQSKEMAVTDLQAKVTEILSKVRSQEENIKKGNEEDMTIEKDIKSEETDSGTARTSADDVENGKIEEVIKQGGTLFLSPWKETDSKLKTENHSGTELTEVRDKRQNGELTKSEDTATQLSLRKDKREGDKENKIEEGGKGDVSLVGKEDTRIPETILKEVNGVKDGGKPCLDKSKKSMSLKNFGVKDATPEQVRPVVHKGFSFSSIGRYSVEPKSEDYGDKPNQQAADQEIIVKGTTEEKKKDQSSAEKPVELSPTKSPPNAIKSGTSGDSAQQEVKLRQKSRVRKDQGGGTTDQPAWIELANRRSKRYSQLMSEAEKKDLQVIKSKEAVKAPTVPFENKNKPPAPVSEKPKVASKPSGMLNKSYSLGAGKEKKTVFRKSLNEANHPSQDKSDFSLLLGNTVSHTNSPQRPNSTQVADRSTSSSDNKNKSTTADAEKPKIAAKPNSLVNKKDAPSAGSSKDSTFGAAEKKTFFRKSLSDDDSTQDLPVTSSFRGRTVPLEKCAVCGTTVYQMEKCNFDNSVFHRQCIKCTVCKRHLTVGNFVVSESKVYCKPHGQAVAVTM